MFSPNGDGHNDYWIVEQAALYKDYDFYIFDTGSRLIFKSKGYNNDWGGSIKENDLPMGSYYYLIKSPDGTKVYRGIITLLR
jgi:gliding motility-associated-like protein